MGFVGWRRQTPPVRTPCSCYPGAAEGPYEIVELLAQTPLSMACTAWQHVLGLSIESHDFLVEPEWAFLVSLAATQRCKFRDLFGSPGRAPHAEPQFKPWDRFTVSSERHVTYENGKRGDDKRAQLLLAGMSLRALAIHDFYLFRGNEFTLRSAAIRNNFHESVMKSRGCTQRAFHRP